jgi:hypothetical protein
LSGAGQDRGTIINFNKMKDNVKAKGEQKVWEGKQRQKRGFLHYNKC